MKFLFQMSVSAVFLSLALIFASCGLNPGSSTGGGGSSAGGGSGNVANALANLPDFHAQVPTSLGGDDMKMKMKAPFRNSYRGGPNRNYGDITTFSPSALNDVKSQGWMDMRDTINQNSPIVMFLGILRSFASNHSVPLDQEVALGICPVPNGPGGGATNMDMGKIICRQPNSALTQVYWKIRIDMAMMTNVFTVYYKIFFNISNYDNGKKLVSMCAGLNGDTNTPLGDLSQMQFYSLFDENANSTVDFSVQGTNNWFMNKSYSAAGGGIIIFSKSIYNDNSPMYGISISTNVSVAWGDNTMGGLINNNSGFSSNVSSYYDNNTSNWYYYTNINTNSSVYTEYYNNTGSLVFKSWGDNRVQDTSWLDSYISYSYWGTNINLKDYLYSSAPSSLSIISFWSNNGSDYFMVQQNGGGYSAPISGWAGSVYFKNSPIGWTSGDAIYWVNNYTWDGYSNIMAYNRGYSVPSTSTYLGQTYFMYNTWPLKYLVLDSTHSNYTITRKELENYTWTNTWYDNVNSTNMTYIYSWTNFDWWLAKTPDTNFNTTNDIRIQNINEQEVWLWDSVSCLPLKQKGYFVNGSDPTPLYFNFTQQPLVNSVNVKVSNYYYSDVVPFNFDTVRASLPAMPPDSSFPNL